MTARWLTVPLVAVAAFSCSPHQRITQTAADGVATPPASATAPATAAVAGAPSVAPVGSTSANATPVAVAPNPFEGASFFLDPGYVGKVENAAKTDKANASLYKKAASNPTAIWLDSIASVSRIGKILTAADKQSEKDGKPVLVMFVVYNLPNRDCSAKASAGELDVEKGGESRYKTEFVDKIAGEFAAHPKLRIVAIVEPDSLPNLATNMNVPKCAMSDKVYRGSIAYAVSKLSMPHVSTYLDAAHTGWLGWEGNRQKIAKIFKDVLGQAGGVDKIRGFATNVSNYNTVSSGDGRKLGPANPCPDEGAYIAKLTEALNAEGIAGKQFIIDTARNGKVVRASWGSWCNVKGAGLGPRPQASPMPLVDAYYWVKPPGESDGTSDPKSARFDTGCAAPDAMPKAPEAGQWFTDHFREMVKNAEPPL